jgi:hypothetical protein
MSHTKVLLLASVKDMASITRESRIKASPLLSGYEMGYFYLIELTQEEFERGEITRTRLDATEIADRLQAVVSKFAPSIVLVHFGLALRRFTSDVLMALDQMHRQFPDIRIVFERKESAVQFMKTQGVQVSDAIWTILSESSTSEDEKILQRLMAEVF